MKQEWPTAKFKIPHTEVNGKPFGPKSDPIPCDDLFDDLVVVVTLTTTNYDKEAAEKKKAHEKAIYTAKLAKVKE